MTSERLDVDIMRMSLLVRWHSVIYPFEQWQFLHQLPENGYVLIDELRNRSPSYGTRIEATGVVAKKGDVSLLLDTSRPGFQLDGRDAEVLVDELDSIETILLDSFRVDSREIARFYEVDTQALVRSEMSPIDVMRRYSTGIDIVEHIGTVLKQEAGVFALKISDATGLPNDENWFEFLLEPSSRSPKSDYFTYLSLRRHDRALVVDIAGRITAIIQEAIERLEQE